MTRLPDVSVERMRDDFSKLFDMHNYECTLIKYSDAQSGDFFDNSVAYSVERIPIRISIQGENESIARLIQGIEPLDKRLRCYVKHDTVEIKPTDMIMFKDKYYILDGLNQGIKSGQTVFYSFGLKYTTQHVP